MIASLSNKHKISLNGSNLIIFTSANRSTKGQSANHSIQGSNPSAQSDHTENDKSQPKMFKIRTFTSKMASAKHPKIEGKRIKQEAINCIREDSQMRILKYNYNNRRPSIDITKEPTNQHSHRLKKNVGQTESAIFRQIQLVNQQKQEKHQVNFHHLDLSQYSQLSYKPHIWINNDRPNHEANPQFVIIFSANLINLDAKKIFKPRQRSYNSQKSVESINSSPFTVDSQSILRNICGKFEKSFFNHCKLYFKVNGNTQMNDLKEFLSENELLNYDGIIDIRGKITQTHRLYSIRQIVSHQQKLILLEEEETLRYQIPFVEGLSIFFITLFDKNLTYTNVNKTVKLLKNAEIQTSKYCLKPRCAQSPKKQSYRPQDKQNYHPNHGFITKSLNKTCKQSIIQASNKKGQSKFSLFVETMPTSRSFKFDWSILASKSNQISQIKKIRQQIRENRSNVRNPGNPPSVDRYTKSRNKSTDYRAEIETTRQAVYSIRLQGDFKEKLVKYVKILENERPANTPKENKYREKGDSKDDDLEQLTTNLTTKMKSKTPFQLVGDMIRNNAHIARQIEKYMTGINPLRKVLDRSEQSCHPTSQPSKDKVLIHTFFL